MLKKHNPVPYFNGYGVALAAEINKPFHEVVESQAATAISSLGGLARAKAGPFNLRGVIQFESATTQIAAIVDDDSYDVTITSRLVGINILNQLTADEIVACLSIKTPIDGGPTRFNTVGSRFVNLRVGGELLQPKLEHECPPDCGNMYTNEDERRPIYDLFHKREDRKPRQSAVTSLVSDLNVPLGCLDSAGHAIHVPDFGVVYLAEYLVTPHGRQLNMFRVKLGCAYSGTGTGGGVGGGPVTSDPPPRPGSSQ